MFDVLVNYWCSLFEGSNVVLLVEVGFFDVNGVD